MKKAFVLAVVLLAFVSLSLAVQYVPGPYKSCGCDPSGSPCIVLFNTTTNQYDPCPSECNISNCQTHTPPGFKKVLMTIQGKIIGVSGVPLDGNVAMRFDFYNQPEGGDLLVSVNKTVQVRDGFFTAVLGLSNAQAKLISLTPTYVQVVVNGNALKPRLVVTSSVSAFNSNFLNGYTAYDFVKKTGDTMFGDLVMNNTNITGADLIQSDIGKFGLIYEGNAPLYQKYLPRSEGYQVVSNIWCNHLGDCYKYTVSNESKFIVYGRVALGNFGSGIVKSGYVHFPKPLPGTPIVIGTMESCAGDYVVNIQSPSKYGFWFRIKNIGQPTSCYGGVFLNFLAMTYGGIDRSWFSPVSGLSGGSDNKVFCYYDGDGDGYYYNGTYSAYKPQWMDSCTGKWKDGSQVIGPDCDDDDPSITTECQTGGNATTCLVDEDLDEYGVYRYVNNVAMCADNVQPDDCDDSNPNIHPGATEVCNGVDDDCDGEIDDNAVCPSGEVCINGTCESVGPGGGGNTPPICETGSYHCLPNGNCYCIE